MLKKYIFSIYAVLLIAFILRFYFALNYNTISPDGTHYTSLAYNIIHDFSYTSNVSQFPDIIQPPLYPFLVSFFTLIFNPAFAGKVVSLIFGLLLIHAVYKFTLYLKPDRMLAACAAWAVALHPGMISISAKAATESLYIFIVFSAITSGWRYIRAADTGLIFRVSFLWLLAYLTRPEGMIYFFFFFLALIFIRIVQKKNWIHIIYYLLPFTIGVSAYSAVTASQLGFVTISPKVSFVRGHARLSAYFRNSDRHTGQKTSLRHHFERFKFALTPDGEALAANALFRRDTDFNQWLKEQNDKVMRRQPIIKNMIKVVLTNADHMLEKLRYGLVLPPLYMILIILGFFILPIKKDHLKLYLYFLFMSSVVFTFLLSHVEDRFLFTLIPLGAVIMGRGIRQLLYFTDQTLGSLITSERILSMSLTFLFIILLTINLPHYYLIHDQLRRRAYYYEMGQELARVLPDDAVIAASRPQAVYFSGRRYQPLPYAPRKKTIYYLKYQNVGYVLLEERDKVLRPGFTANWNTLSANPHLQLIKNQEIDKHQFYLYKINNAQKTGDQQNE